MAEVSESFEQRLLTEIAKVNAEILSLQSERDALQRMLLRSRRENAANTEVARINSGGRILIEQTIINYLKRMKGRICATRELIQVANRVDPSINGNTFRSHLHRLKLRGAIESAGNGKWFIAPTTE